jgi:SAM-dependent methyltransferase
MSILNLGCGAVRPGPPFINADNLRTQLIVGTPERTNLDREMNYLETTLPATLPFNDGHFDGILCGHVIEHFDCMDSVKILDECHRLLAPGGLLVVSVPDADYFLKVHDRDNRANAIELFGEPINPTEWWFNSFLEYGLFFGQHKQIITEGTLRCLLIRAGFWSGDIFQLKDYLKIREHPLPMSLIEPIMNRRKFSLELCATKYLTTAQPATSPASAP